MRKDKRFSALGAAVVGVIGSANLATAATHTWEGSSGTGTDPRSGIWSADSYWANSDRPPFVPDFPDYTTRATTELIFRGSNVNGPYVSTHDFDIAAELNILRFGSTASQTSTITNVEENGTVWTNSSLRFVNNGTTTPRLFQDGSGAFNVDLAIDFSVKTIFAGAGTGRINLTKALSGPGAIEIQGGNTWITGDANLTTAAALEFGTTGGGGGTLTLDHSVGASRDRLADSINLTFGAGGGNLSVNGAGGGSTETVGNVTVTGGANRLHVSQTATLQTGTFTRNGGLVDFANTGGTLGAAASSPRILFASAPTLTNSLIGGWATVNGQDFATYGANGVSAFTGYVELPASGFSPTTNYQSTATNLSLTGSGDVYTVKFNAPAAQTINLGANNLNITGGILKVGAGTTTINGTGSIGSGASDLIMTISQGAMTFNAPFAATSWTKAGAGGLNLTIANNPVWQVGSFSGVVTLNVTADSTAAGQLVGGGSIVKNGAGKLTLTNQNSGWSGGTTINNGTVELLANSSATGINLDGRNSPLGTTGTININGGTLKATTLTGGTINLSRAVTFGANGGTLDLNNTAGGTLNSNFGLTTAGTTNVAVIKFNGGQGSFSDVGNPPNWNAGGNVLRMSSYSGTGPVRVELTKAGTYRQGNGSGGTITIPMAFTIAGQPTVVPAGQVGGDPTSGPNGTINTSTSTNTGHVANDNFATVVYSQGLNLEGALQFSAQGGARQIGGNITLKGTASGNPAYVAFNGRGTGTVLSSVINAPGAGAVGQNPLYVGRTTDTLTIEDGAIAAMDIRIRTDQQRSSGAFLEAATVINAGGTLRFLQSTAGASNAFSGYNRVNNRITGQGTTAKESVVDIYLPAADPASNTEIRFNGVSFNGTSVPLVVNGTGLGGLRVNGLSRPTALLGAADTVNNADKVANLLTSARLQGLTGSGGFLTPAAQNATFNFPAASEWANSVNVGLRVANENGNANAADVALPTGGTWSHHLHVDAGAELGADGVTVNAGNFQSRVSGLGTIGAGAGGVTFATGTTVAPGAAGVAGTLAVKGSATLNTGATLAAEITGATSGALKATGNVNVTGSTLTVTPTSLTGAPRKWDVVAADTDNDTVGGVVGQFGTVNLPANETGQPAGLNRVWSIVYAPKKVSVGYTILGDADYSGAVNFDDLLILASNYNQTNEQWSDGNFNPGTGPGKDTLVNFDDLLVLASNYNKAAPTPGDVPGASAAFQADLAMAFAAVPEPATVGFLGLGLAGLLGGRRRRNRA